MEARVDPKSPTWDAVMAHINDRVESLTRNAMADDATAETRASNAARVAELRKLAGLGTKQGTELKLTASLVVPQQEQ